MKKQEEIREGVLKILYGVLADSVPYKELHPEMKQQFEDDTNNVLSYLHSQGVVIKVKKKKPLVDGTFEDFSRCGHPFNFHDGYYKARKDILRAGYVATEPIIGKEQMP